jgi:hypothetical protein
MILAFRARRSPARSEITLRWRALTRSHDPIARAEHLAVLAEHYRFLAGAEGDRDQVQRLLGAARLLGLLADAETRLALRTSYDAIRDTEPLAWNPDVRPLLAQLAGTAPIRERAELLRQWHPAAARQLGEAAELLLVGGLAEAAEVLLVAATAYYELAGYTRTEARRWLGHTRRYARSLLRRWEAGR